MGTIQDIASERLAYARDAPTSRPTVHHAWLPPHSYPHLCLVCWSEDGQVVRLSISRDDAPLSTTEVDVFLKAFGYPGGQCSVVQQTISGRAWSTQRYQWTPTVRTVRRAPRKLAQVEDLL